ncbi:hypothetical protein BDN70DRAFT_882756 [Pholiota conissans]|uniref:Uncharacterized protein n=1 Tax=Pholiota conissans TaxID=109636 RepID=A0A9P5YUT7_9AGAR|nr:hypothetical protein BDN70DRAFT_882756 [Pholiota conissans]
MPCYTSDEATSPGCSTPDFSRTRFVLTENIPVLSLDGSAQQEHENEKEEIPELTLDEPSTLGFFSFDPFDMYTSYPEFGCIPDAVPVPRTACGADMYAEPAMGVSYAGDGRVGYQQSEADLEQLFLAQMEYGIGNYELFGMDNDDAPILS